MALRYFASRIGVPALGRASGSRLAQPAGTPRRLSSSSSHQGGHDNGAWKPLLTDAERDRLHAEFIAECEAIKEAIRKDRRDTNYLIGACCTGAGMMLLAMWYETHKQMEKARYWRSKLLE